MKLTDEDIDAIALLLEKRTNERGEPKPIKNLLGNVRRQLKDIRPEIEAVLSEKDDG